MESTTKDNGLSTPNNSLCRVCLSANEDNKCIFTLHKNLDHDNYSLSDLSEKLQLYGGIEVSQNDGFPGKMCSECISKMCIAHGFRAQCQETDRILRAAYEKNLNVHYWIKEEFNDSVERKLERSLKFDKVEEISGEQSLSSPTSETAIEEKQDNKSISKKQLPSSSKLIISKKINSDKLQSQWRFCNDKKMQNCNADVSNSELSSQDFENEISSTAISSAKEEMHLMHAEMSKKEAFRSRRFIVFKRITSMQSLKNHKERQRQYMKKTVYTKNSRNDRDTKAEHKRKHNLKGVRKVSESNSNLEQKCLKRSKSYSSNNSLKNHDISRQSGHQLSHEFEEFPYNQKNEPAELFNSEEKLKPATCKICNKHFRKVVTMVRHLNVHKRDNPRAVYSILKDMRDKRKIRNVDTSIDIERRSFTNCEKKIASEPKIYSAMLENERVSRPDTLNIHLNEDDNSSEILDTAYSFNCDQCGKHYANAKFLPGNFPSREEQQFVCTACYTNDVVDEEIKSNREVRENADDDNSRKNSRHVVNVEPENPPDDERTAIKLINMWIKEELDSDNEGKVFPCKNCNKSYATEKSLLKHEAKMHEIPSETYCTTCGKDCTCGVEKIEENRDKPQEKSVSYTCEECNKIFEKQVKLEKHMRIHARAKEQKDANFKRFLCHICSKTFRQNTGLMFHMRTHTGYKPHVCKYCGRGFTSNSNCINHERTHTGDRPFVCHFCSAAFAKSCTLKAHITTHTGEANYHCKTCGKSFRRLKYLKEHRFTHTGEKPYACKICGTAYSHSGSLFVHEKKCKAQHSNYHALSGEVPASQNYCHNQSAPAGQSTVVIAPIISTLPPGRSLVASINNSLNTHENKNHCSTTANTTIATIHSSTNNPDETSTVRSFTIIGQMFHA